MNLERYQERAVEWLYRRRRGLVIAPAGSGKTIIAAAAIDRVLRTKRRIYRPLIGWMANTIEQCEQAKDALARFPEIGALADVTIACAAAGRDWGAMQALIVDEAHHAPAPGWREQIETCRGAVWGFTATPESEDEIRDAELGTIFPEAFVIDRSEVNSRVTSAKVVLLSETDPHLKEPIDKAIEAETKRRSRWYRRSERSEAERQLKKLAALESRAKQEDSEEKAKEALATIAKIDAEIFRMCAWHCCIELGIIRNVSRNSAVIRLAILHAHDRTLVLVNQIDHGIALAGRIPGSVLCYSKMSKRTRKGALEGFREGTIRCLIATSLADEGLDLPMANVLILVSGGRSKAKTEQRTGRVLRTFAGKEGAIIYDFEDRQHPLMRKHALARQALYKKLGYSIEEYRGTARVSPPLRIGKDSCS